jgi:hypothetical protein
MITVKLMLPPAALSSNSRAHWSARAEATRWYRNAAMIALRAACKKVRRANHVRLHVSYDITKSLDPGYRPRDIMNGMSALKPAVDGLVDAGLVKDDSWKHLSWGSLEITKQGSSGVTIMVEVIENEQ